MIVQHRTLRPFQDYKNYFLTLCNYKILTLYRIRKEVNQYNADCMEAKFKGFKRR